MWTNIPQVEGSQTFQSKAELSNTVWLYRNSQLFRFKSSQNQKKPVTVRLMSLKLLLWLRIQVKSSIKSKFSSWLVEFQRTFLSLKAGASSLGLFGCALLWGFICCSFLTNCSVDSKSSFVSSFRWHRSYKNITFSVTKSVTGWGGQIWAPVEQILLIYTFQFDLIYESSSPRRCRAHVLLPPPLSQPETPPYIFPSE